MVDSLVLFEQIVNHPLLDKPSFVLFLNKKDLYEKKIQRVDIKDYFPEYADKPKSNSRGISFFKKKFLSQSKNDRAVVVHVTCCTDTNSMKVIINNLIASVMRDNLRDIGIVQ
ncbi:guanine nucleotide-binding protein subunit alpha [Boothiomyces sp. JEL0838]|nr:guanine nucleotide-binding protein subunit alpha [Boothiomyces sp. JEL0838]